MTFRDEIEIVVKRYAKYGYTKADIVKMIKSAPEGITPRGALLGVRMVLGVEHDETEWFCMSDLCEITGEPEDVIKKMLEEKGIEGYRITSPFFGNIK